MTPRGVRASPWMLAATFVACAALAGCGDAIQPTLTPSAHGSASPPALSTTPTGTNASSQPVLPPPSTQAAATSFAATESDLHLPTALSRSVALAAGARILVAGGLTASGTSAAVLALDPATATVTSIGKLKHAAHDAAAGELNGKLLVIGGGDQTAAVWIQVVAADGKVANGGTLPKARADLGAASVGDQLIVAGGSDGANVDLQVLATTDGIAFTAVAKLLQGVRYAAVAAMGGKVYVIGGEVGTGDTDAVQIVDPAAGTVTLGTPLAGPLAHATALVVGGAILVMGGRHHRKASSLIQRIDPGDGSVKMVGQLPYNVSDTAGVVLDGKAYLIGGEAAKPLDSIIVVTPGQ